MFVHFGYIVLSILLHLIICGIFVFLFEFQAQKDYMTANDRGMNGTSLIHAKMIGKNSLRKQSKNNLSDFSNNLNQEEVLVDKNNSKQEPKLENKVVPTQSENITQEKLDLVLPSKVEVEKKITNKNKVLTTKKEISPKEKLVKNKNELKSKENKKVNKKELNKNSSKNTEVSSQSNLVQEQLKSNSNNELGSVITGEDGDSKDSQGANISDNLIGKPVIEAGKLHLKRTDKLKYPKKCQRLGKEGSVYLLLDIDNQGLVSNVEIKQKNEVCDDFNNEAIRFAKSRQYVLEKKQYPNGIYVNLRVNFKLK